MIYGYIAKLNNNKWYVGSADSTPSIQTITAKYARTHGIQELSIIVQIRDKEWVKSTTLGLMRVYGWQNVRGYAWTQANMKQAPAEIRDEVSEAVTREFYKNDEYVACQCAAQLLHMFTNAKAQQQVDEVSLKAVDVKKALKKILVDSLCIATSRANRLVSKCVEQLLILGVTKKRKNSGVVYCY